MFINGITPRSLSYVYNTVASTICLSSACRKNIPVDEEVSPKHLLVVCWPLPTLSASFLFHSYLACTAFFFSSTPNVISHVVFLLNYHDNVRICADHRNCLTICNISYCSPLFRPRLAQPRNVQHIHCDIENQGRACAE